MDEEQRMELQNKERHLGNIERELGLAYKQLPDIKLRQEMLEREMDLTNKQVSIALDHFKIIKPTWEFETTEEYHTILKELNKLNHEKKVIEFGMLRDRLFDQERAVVAQIESLVKEKERVEKWMEENKEVNEDGTGTV